jgi:hypothetical protein
VAGADVAGVHEPLLARALRTQRVEDRHRPLDQLGRPADHQAVAVLQAPDPTRDAAVEVADPLLREQRGVGGVVGVAGVAAVDDQVARLEHVGERPDRAARDLAGGHHHPHHARSSERRRQRVERVDVTDIGPRVVPDHLVP